MARSFAKIFLMCALFIRVLPSHAGGIYGVVVDKKSKEPLAGVNIILVGTTSGSATGADGRYEIRNLSDGVYSVMASIIGYERVEVKNINITQDRSYELNFALSVEAIPLNEVIVTPGRFSLAAKAINTKQTLKREDIRSFPQFGEDIYRAVTRLPGLTGSDYSSRFAVRGGEQDEVLVMLDGLELYDPFHLKDFGGSVSVIDVEAIGGIDMMTGAFSAEFGNRLSGVFDIQTANPGFGNRRTSLAISFMNARFLTEGSFADGRGQWMLLARRGYIDLLLKLIGENEDLAPFYYDVLSKVRYQLNKNNNLSLNFLRSDDDLKFRENEDEAKTGYGNTYAWVTWRSSLSEKLFKQSVFSTGHITAARDGFDISENLGVFNYEVSDERSFDFWGLRQDWTFELLRNLNLKWGGEFKKLSANYDYFNYQRVTTEIIDNQVIAGFDTATFDLKPSGEQIAAYLSARVRIAKPLTAEVGLRYDRASWTSDEHWSPRVNVSLAFSRQTSLRLGWGNFYQTQGIHELDIPDRDATFYPAELAEHRVAGLEHQFENGINVRIEGYQKKISNLRPWYQNLLNDLSFFPEVEDDRVRLLGDRAEAKGIEVFVKQDEGEKFNWWASYGYAFAEDDVRQIESFVLEPSLDFPRSKDQRHTVYLDFGYKPNPKWRLNLTWQYHSGWPYTREGYQRVDNPDGSFFFQRTFGRFNEERYPAYHRMDFRINRFFEMQKGVLSVFFEVRNLYNRKNIRVVDAILRVNQDGSFVVNEEREEWLPILPSFGISYDF